MDLRKTGIHLLEAHMRLNNCTAVPEQNPYKNRRLWSENGIFELENLDIDSPGYDHSSAQLLQGEGQGQLEIRMPRSVRVPFNSLSSPLRKILLLS